jgi:two-component system, LytTR family, sensor kinase
LTRVRLSIAAGIMFLTWFAGQSVVMHQSGIPFSDAFADSALFASIFAFASWLAGTILQYFRPDIRNLAAVLLGNAILAAGITLAYPLVSAELIPDYPRLTGLYENAERIVFLTSFLLLCLYTYINMIRIAEEENRLERIRKNELESLSKEAELAGLRLQLQPHFLFNSLNSVSALLANDPDGARNMIQLLSDFLRGTIRKDPGQFIMLSEELEHLKLYFQIEQVRFAGRLKVILDPGENTNQILVPALILQPLMENAIKHGVYGTTGPVEILLQATSQEKMAIVSISNPYAQDEGPSQPGTGFGLASVKRRLQLMYNRPDLVHIHAEEGIFTTTIRIPQ